MSQNSQHQNGHLDEHIGPFRRWLMWVIVAIFYCYENFLQVSPNVMNGVLRTDLHLSAEGIGHLGGVYFCAYALMQIPVGMLLDNMGVKKLLSFAVFMCALGSWIFAGSHGFVLASIGRFLIGMGSAFAAITCMQVAAMWLPPKRFALLAGVMLTMGMLGAAGAQLPLHWLISHLGWRQTMHAFAWMGLAITALVLVFMIDRPSRGNNTSTHAPWWQSLKATLTKQQVWWVCLYGGLMFWSTPIFGGLWGSNFLTLSLNISKAQAANMIQYLFFGWALGAPLFGWFSDRIGRRLPPLYIASFSTMLALLLLLYTHHLPLVCYFLLLFAMGFFTSGFLPIFSIIRDISADEHTATGLGFANTINMVGPALINPLIGWLLDRQSQGTLLQGARIDTLGSYQHAIMILPICVGLSLLCLPWIRETYCRQQSSRLLSVETS